MAESRSDKIYYHPEIEIELGEEFGIDPHGFGGDLEREDSARVLDVQPFVLRGFSKGRLKLLQLLPDPEELADVPLEFPAGNPLPVIFSLFVDKLRQIDLYGLNVDMRYGNGTYHGIRNFDHTELSQDGTAQLKFWTWNAGGAECYPLFPLRAGIISAVRFSFRKES